MEKTKIEHWHIEHAIRQSRLAEEMGRLFTPGHEGEQTSEYERARQEYLWGIHMKAEHDKFDPPDYSNHRFS